jgi:ArsR family transcriptional regulator, arsenate/arsenite/antimonite-responsive transcriptional repressor
MAKYRNNIDEVLNITKALSDENRVRALMMLGGGELCVCQIIEVLGLAPSTVSKHMSILKQAGLVKTRKDGRWIYYRLTDNDSQIYDEIIGWLSRNLSDSESVLKDAGQLGRDQKKSKERLCECYKN